jgi:hypothetical protein
MSSVINQYYEHACRRPTDIYEHLPTLRAYASECGVVAEMGVSTIVSTWAFLKGLTDSPVAPKKLICVDIEPTPKIVEVSAIAKNEGVELTFQQCDSVNADLGDGVDMLFIDTWHVYGHLRRELAAHHAKTRRYIVMHDTTVDAIHGESVRCGSDVQLLMAQTGYSLTDVTTGLDRAIVEFLAEHPEWLLVAKYENNNGLTILMRK